jgi:hypothetical protein
MEGPADCAVAAWTSAPPASAAIDFLVPGLSGHHFVAWGGEGGAINIGCVQVRVLLA